MGIRSLSGVRACGPNELRAVSLVEQIGHSDPRRERSDIYGTLIASQLEVSIL